MRHFFGYDIDGRLRSIETYGPRGWPVCDCDSCSTSELDSLTNPACVAPRCISLRETRIGGSADVVGFMLYDCSCDPEVMLVRECKCIASFGGEHYVDIKTQTFLLKPSLTVKLDGETLEHRQVANRAPGTAATLKLLAPGIPDGEKAKLFQKGSIDIHPDDEVEVAFADGESEAVTLVAPAQGAKGVMVVDVGKYVRGFAFQLRGFAVP